MHAMPKIHLHHFKKTGFTLIELLVVVAITSIVVGGAIAGFTGFSERQQVLTAAQEVRQLFVTAKTKAQAREMHPDCDNSQPLQYYRVRVVDADTFRVQAYCKDSGGMNIARTVRQYDLPTGVTKVSPLDPYSVPFSALTGSYTGASDLTVTLQKTGDSSVSYSFTVTTGGAISDVQ